MEEHDISLEISTTKTRNDMIRYLDGYSSERMDELYERKTKRPLVKSYILEHTGHTEQQKPLRALLRNFQIESQQMDKDLLLVYDKKTDDQCMGFIELLSKRYFVFYTPHKSEVSDKWVRNLVLSTPELDHIWLSGTAFEVLWERVIQLSKAYRYVSMIFKHDSVYQIGADDNSDIESDEMDQHESSQFEDRDEMKVDERRASLFKLVDQVCVIQEKLGQLQKLYSPLNAICQLRFPSPIGRGGHDFYENGKVTNRSGNFRDHRNHIIYIQRIYDQLMNETENKAWYSVEKETVSTPGQINKLVGTPVFIEFKESLSEKIFNQWINSVFGRVNEPHFKLWGNPIRLGPTKVHVYGVDKHLWKPIFLELSNKNLTAIVPKGTCGNTIHRLICNIQRYIDPAATAYIGNLKYKKIVDESSLGVKYEQSS